MNYVKNKDYDVDVKCLWCHYEFILIAQEVWYDAYHCPNCKKPTGMLKYSYGHKRASFDENRSGLVPYARVDLYIFKVKMNKGKVMAFLTEFMKKECGGIKEIYSFMSMGVKGKWSIKVEARKILRMDGVEWYNPPLAQAQ